MIINATGLSANDTEQPLSHPIIGYDNVVTTSNIEATSSDDDYPVTNVANPSTALRWLAGSPSPDIDHYLTLTDASAQDFDYVAVARHNFGTAGITVSIEAQEFGSPAPGYTEIVQETLPTDDSPILFRFAPAQYANIRLRMQPGSAPATVAVLYIGKLLEMQRSVDVGPRITPPPYARRVDAIDGFSQGGQFLGRVIENQNQETETQFMHLEPAWYRTYFDPFVEAAIGAPFFFGWSPEDYPAELGFMWIPTNKVPRPEINPVTQRFDVTLEMVGIA